MIARGSVIALAAAFLIAEGLGPGFARAQAQATRPAVAPPDTPTWREMQLEDRLRRLEARYESMDARHRAEYEELSKRYESLQRRVTDSAVRPAQAAGSAAPPDTSSEGGAGARDNPAGDAMPAPIGAGDVTSELSVRSDTSSDGGAGARDNPAEPSPSDRSIGGPARIPMKVIFGPGFELMSEDEEFQLQFHLLSQVDLRIYEQSNQDPVHSGFSLPRERIYFMGRLTRPLEYYLTINRSFGSLDLLDVFLNFHYDDRLQLKVGRFKTPYSYEFYAISGPDLIVPDRSLFSVNFTPNRQVGLMGWGQLFDRRLDYAVGIFNGNRASFQDTNEPKDVISYVNARPFQKKVDNEEEEGVLQHLNLGGSVTFGNEQNPIFPAILRTSVASTNAADATNIAPPFLAFNKDAVANGYRSLWGLHAAYFRKGLSLIGEWSSGYDTYSRGTSAFRTAVPLSGYYVAAGYFLTGETMDRRTQVEVRRPFDLRKGKFGTGAIELAGRYSAVSLGPQVFNAGFADPNLWTDRAYTIDLGANWYLNNYTKIYFFWEHAGFATPVLYRPGGLQLTSDMYWMRFQVYF